MRRAAWLQQHGEKLQSAAADAENSDTDIVINNDVNVISAKTLESSDEAEKSDTDMVISPAIDTVCAKILESSDVHEVETTQKIKFSCDMCEFIGESSNEIKIHMSRKHNDIPQLDGGNSECRKTDCWWDKRFKNPLKMFQVFKDVMMDIDESPLSKEEKCFDHENVTSARKEVLGNNF